MKIILAAKSVYPFHPFGGVQKYVYHYAKYLSKNGVDVEIVAPLDNKRKERTEKFENITYTFLSPSIYRYLEYPIGWLGVHFFSRSLAKYLSRKTFDLLHAFDMTAFQYLKANKRRPVITHTFTDNFLTNPISSGNLIKKVFSEKSKADEIKKTKIIITPFSEPSLKRKYWIQYQLKTKPMAACFHQSDKIFFEADVFAKQINEAYRLDTKKSDILPVGVDLHFIQEKLGQGNMFINREQLGFKEDDIVLMTVNRLAADKGVDKIVLSLSELIKTNSKIKLIIIGSGYQEAEIKKIIEEKNLKEYIRHFKDVPENELYFYYRLSDIYLSVFSYPGSSLSTLEAMACSLPVITTAQPWLVENKKNGVAIQNNESATIKSAVLNLIESGRLKEMGNESLRGVQPYDWQKVALAGIRKYEHMLGVRL